VIDWTKCVEKKLSCISALKKLPVRQSYWIKFRKAFATDVGGTYTPVFGALEETSKVHLTVPVRVRLLHAARVSGMRT
jgi:hypothetical protein